MNAWQSRSVPPPVAIRQSSMIVPRHEFLRHALVFDGWTQHHAVGELFDQLALDLLPRCLARREMIAALLLQRLAPGLELGVWHQYVGGAAVEVDAHTVAGLEQRQPAACRRFRRGVE